MTISFPFFGAGKAEYFESYEILVKFSMAPDRSTRKKIIEWAPPPFELADYDFYNSVLVATIPDSGDEMIQKYYGSKKDLWPKVEDADFHCTPMAADAFEKAILGWLTEVDKIAPIEVVWRNEDVEAGGTLLSELHHESVKQIPKLIETWKDESETRFEEEELAHIELLIAGILFYSQEKSVANYGVVREKFLPFQNIQILLGTKNFKKLEILLKTKSHSNVYFEKLCNGFIEYLSSDHREDDVIVRMIYWMIEDPRFLHLILYHNARNNHVILIAAIQKKDFALVKRICTIIATVPDDHLNRFTQPIYWEVSNTVMPAKRWQVGILLYEFVIDLLKAKSVVHGDRSFYCNVLWALQNDNTGLPVNKALNEKVLSLCLPQGESNSAVFYNAACLYVEMDEVDLAFDCIKRAVVHGIKGSEYEGMLRDLSTHPLFGKFRETPEIKMFIAALPATKD
jgi:hypothetical protein